VAPTPRLAFLRRATLGFAGGGISLVYCMGRLLQRAATPRHAQSRLIARDTARVMSRLACRGAGIEVRVVDGERLATSQPCVYVANHQSVVDYPILAKIFPERTVVVGKVEIGAMPLIGWLFRTTGNVLLARGDSKHASRTLDDLIARVRSDGTSVWMFPEGTRRRDDSAMLPFRSGAFRIAAQAGVPIVPVVVSSLKPHIDLAGRRLERTTVTIRVLAPRTMPDHYPELKVAMEETRQAMMLAFRSMATERPAAGR
jgi:1-acyl-sn-glycerol-3-phosphate acyltransferase